MQYEKIAIIALIIIIVGALTAFLVTSSDIDIFDKGQVEWALATRVQPHRDIIVTDNGYPGIALDPSIHPDVRPIPHARTSKIGIDATTRFKGHDFATVVVDSEERKKQIEKRWKEYGFKI